MWGVRPRGREKGSSAKSIRVVGEGSMEEVGSERSAELEREGKEREQTERAAVPARCGGRKEKGAWLEENLPRIAVNHQS